MTVIYAGYTGDDHDDDKEDNDIGSVDDGGDKVNC